MLKGRNGDRYIDRDRGGFIVIEIKIIVNSESEWGRYNNNRPGSERLIKLKREGENRNRVRTDRE